jgi:filamentous hemagglutinin
MAGNDLTVTGSNIAATHDLSATAGRDLILDAATETYDETHYYKEKKSGFSASSLGAISYGKSSLTQNANAQGVSQVTSTLEGENVALVSGRDTVLRAATILADQDIRVLAGRNIDILAVANTQEQESHTKSSSTSIGFTPEVITGRWTMFSKDAASQDNDGQAVTQNTALLSANAGDLTLLAGLDSSYKGTGQGNLTTQGADLLAAQSITLSGNAVDLQAATDSMSSHSLTKSKSFTIGARPVGVLADLVLSAVDAIDRSQNTDNDRLAGAYALKAGYDAWKFYDKGSQLGDAATAGVDAGSASSGAGGFGVQVYIGSSKSKSESSSSESHVTGTNLQARNIDITATETDLRMEGAKLQAENIVLSAERDILLEAAANTAEVHNKNKSSSAGVGVSFAFGGQQNGFSFQLNAGQALGKANGSETTWDNTLITASDSLQITSGRDTTLRGAQLAGDTVRMDIGGNLLIETLQDLSRYESEQSSSGFSISLCIPPICGGTTVTASASLSGQEIKHDYQSAVGQSGIASGDGGFDITVKGNTELVGAAITSTQTAIDEDRNSLTTASLASRDLTNVQSTESSSGSMGFSYSSDGSLLSNLANSATSNLLGNLVGDSALPDDQDEQSQTLSVISPANITIRRKVRMCCSSSAIGV